MAVAASACAVQPRYVISHAVSATLTEDQSIKAKTLVADTLKDPESAKFKHLKAAEAVGMDGSVRVMVCGFVNGKNSYGGYTGYSAFTVVLTGFVGNEQRVAIGGNVESFCQSKLRIDMND
jgi:hypothetical protein